MSTNVSPINSINELAKVALHVANTKKSEYFACGSCRREFYSHEEYLNHPCCQKKSNSGYDSKAMIGKFMRQGVLGSKIAGVPSELARDSPYMREAIAHGVVGGHEDNDVSLDVDIRLSATKEITDMKTEMIRSGIPCNTMTADETRKAYAEFKAKQTDNLGIVEEKKASSSGRKSGRKAMNTAAT